MDDFTKELIKELMKSKWGKKKMLKIVNKIAENRVSDMCKQLIFSEYDNIPANATLQFKIR